MYRRHKDWLTMREIAGEWAKERQSGDAEEDVTSELLQAFWMGDLTGGRLVEKQPAVDPLHALVTLLDTGTAENHPGIAICQTEDELQSMITHRDDGTIEVDLRTGILLPSDQQQWTVHTCEKAYEKLANLRFEDYGVGFRTMFSMLRITKGDFLAFIRRRKLQPPRFWYDPADPLSGISPSTCSKKTKTASALETPRRGRKTSYDYSRIAEFLDRLRYHEGHAAFNDQTALHERVRNQLGASNVPKRSQFGKYLKRYCAEHFVA